MNVSKLNFSINISCRVNESKSFNINLWCSFYILYLAESLSGYFDTCLAKFIRLFTEEKTCSARFSYLENLSDLVRKNRQLF